MVIRAEIMENGVLRVKSPTFKPGEEILLEIRQEGIRNADKGRWSEVEKALAKADALDFPRRTNNEIIHDLHDLRS